MLEFEARGDLEIGNVIKPS